ncbi:preprotein translocase subunit SecA [Geomonas nitrogeniifigens]|uniref:Protein translocase subunit SecA n=1 Tax=Geomonas diazotrophica TaxID=2843197 RepID=A0ABX8JIN1_9BACT|nr:preprotein translocase subunit SecA [Geomonas nitrogeniifigens]QWV97603.1 preprotein translocase subunit SecA [Geomonas nitrogeniifigens]
MFDLSLFPPARLHGRYPENLLTESRLEHALRAGLGRLPLAATVRPSLLRRLAGRVEQAGESMRLLDDRELAAVARTLKPQLRRAGLRRDLVVRAFALVREVASRRVGMRHYPVQVMGGFVLLLGMVAEMETGEGKTLTATLAACTAALAGIPVHVITVNDYLARRDAGITRPIYDFLGLSVGTIVSGMSPAARRETYACDIAYCTNKEVVFDYLKDRIALGSRPGAIQLSVRRLCGKGGQASLLMRGLPFAIVDEADSVLIDEARTPLIISGPGAEVSDGEELYHNAVETAARFEEGAHFTIDHGKRTLELTEDGKGLIALLAAVLGSAWQGARRREQLITQALSALHLFKLDRDYLVHGGKVKIIDEYTGRVMADRSWELGLHQLIEAKEGLAISPRNETIAKISYQRFFRRYCFLAGMTGTAREVAGELWSVYRLNVVRVGTNKPLIRTALPFRYYKSLEEKWRALGERVRELHQSGRPVLIGTKTVAASEEVSRRLWRAGVQHVVLNARQDENEAQIIAEAGNAGKVTVATNMAGRGTDIHLGPEVKELGGLHVIATELHDAKRIDRQLFGRCGRQGDPGSYEALVSFEDEIFSRRSKTLVGVVACRCGGEGVLGRVVARLFSDEVQRWMQNAHFHLRSELLRFDEQSEKIMAFSGKGE